MDPTLLSAFAALSLLLVPTPGADWAFAITAGLRRRNVGASVGGLASGYVGHVGLVTAGAGALVAHSGAALNALTFVGATYLAWLGIGTARHPTRVVAGDGIDETNLRAGLRGAAISGLNPKGLLLFFAVLPQFVSPHTSWPPSVQLAVLGSIHVVNCAAVYLGVAMASRRILSARPRASEIVARTSGLVMIAVAVGLTLERAVAA
jgi:threonine/homoserine/homoserine lactone efflux protein